LTNIYADLVNENADLLKEYHTALYARDMLIVNRIAAALPAIEQFRKDARDIMVAHRATHDATDGAATSGK